MRRATSLARAALAIAALLGVACAKGPSEDPWQSFNRPVFRFNDTADQWVLRPVARGWTFVTFEQLRFSVRRFFFNLAFPSSQAMTAPGGTRLAWAPDGKSFLYVGPGTSGTQLWRRSLDALDAVPIQGTDGASSPFFSPDGSRIGFINLNPFAVRLVTPTGGSSTVLVGDSLSGGGASWSDDNYIYFDGLTKLERIRPDLVPLRSEVVVDVEHLGVVVAGDVANHQILGVFRAGVDALPLRITRVARVLEPRVTG